MTEIRTFFKRRNSSGSTAPKYTAPEINCRYELRKYEKQADESYRKGEAKKKAENALAIVSKVPVMKNIVSDVRTMGCMVTDYAKGRYREVPYRTIISVLAALIYVISPVDAIPDNIPGVGYIDDAAVVSYVVNSIDSDLEKYRKWKGI